MFEKYFERKRKEAYFQAKTEDLRTQLNEELIDKKSFDEEMKKLFSILEK
jgi:hypothetical protein